MKLLSHRRRSNNTMVEHEIVYYSSLQEAFLPTEGRSNNTMVEHKITSTCHFTAVGGDALAVPFL
jgi:hypothetical protein